MLTHPSNFVDVVGLF